MVYRSRLDVVGSGVVPIRVVLGAVKDSDFVACIDVNKMIRVDFRPTRKMTHLCLAARQPKKGRICRLRGRSVTDT